MADRITVQIEGGEELLSKLDRLGVNVQAAMRRAGLAAAQVIRDDARRRAAGPHVEMEVVQSEPLSVEVEIGADKEHFYYEFFEHGAQPHAIRPKNRKLLRFFTDDGAVFVPGVQHPGMGARPWLRPALDENQDAAMKAARDVLARAVLEVAK